MAEPLSSLTGALAFRDGYVAFRNWSRPETVGSMPTAWFSSDARVWSAASLGAMVPNCPGWGPEGDEDVPDTSVAAGATDGRTIVLVGSRWSNDEEGCSALGRGANAGAVAWVSTDGRSWRRSPLFGDGGGAVSIWAVSGGWQAAVGHGMVANGLQIWDSSDGLSWERTSFVGASGAHSAVAASDGAGRVILRPVSNEPEAWRLRTASDGGPWRYMGAAGCEADAEQILPPLALGLRAWVIRSDWTAVSAPLLCTSPDARTWMRAPLPGGDGPVGVRYVAQTRFGVLAIGESCWAAGCQGSEHLAWISSDGRTWGPVDAPPGFVFEVVDGRSGVIALGAPDAGTDFELVAWRLMLP